MPVRHKILVVESDPDLLIVLEKFLEDVGFITIVTWDGGEALRLIDSDSFAAVVVGEHPQSVRCLDVVRRLRQRQPETACIVLDGPESRREKDELHALGVQAVISKWNLKEVVETVRTAGRPGTLMLGRSRQP